MLYNQYVTFSDVSQEQSYASCPFHVDKTPSFTVNMETEEWYCHSCGRGGKEIEFIMEYYDVPKETAAYALKVWQKKKQMPFPTQETVDKYKAQLQARPREVEVLKRFGMTDEIIEEFEIGYEDTRIIIPVKSRTGHIVNLRKYLPPHRRIEGSNNAKCISERGLGARRFFPYIAFDSKEDIYVVEGEKDCLVARSQGLNAVTSTGGSSIPVDEVGLFRDKNVVLMLDTDTVGEKTSKLYARLLQPIAASVKVIKLPAGDFTEYLEHHSVIDLPEYITEVSEAQMNDEAQEVQDVSLVTSEFSDFLGTWVRLKDMSVVGVEPKIYTVPRKIRAMCYDTKCTRPCALSAGMGAHYVDVNPRHLLEFIDGADTAQDNFVRKHFGCKSVVAEPADFVNVQKIIFQESASFIDGLDDASFESRFGVYLYTDFRLLPTLKYNFEACRVTNPKNQQNYYVIRKAESLNVDRPAIEETVFEKFREIAERATSMEDLLNIHYQEWLPALGIEGRADLFGAILLTYCSVTEIPWQAGLVKGWLDTMVIGDTRTGKSQMAQRFVKVLKKGGYINGENARRTGVIGSVQRFGDSWVITWGAIPMNDKGLLFIDEASGLDIEDIKDLSSTRSSGAVTINKVVKGEARARTRLIWMSNPRSGKNLDEYYWKGYGAFQEFIPIAEDQARFDLVLTASREDVDFLEGIEETHTPDVDTWSDLFQSAWSIPKEDIVMSKSFIKRVRELSHEVGKEFAGGPLIVPVAVHEKLLRLSAAFAVLCGQIRRNKLYLEEKHLEFAVEYLRYIITKPSFGYQSYVKEFQRAYNKTKENTSYLRTLLALHPALKMLLSSSSFKGYQFQEILGIDRAESSKIMSDLITKGLLRPSTGANYVPDKMLIEIAKQMEV